MTAVDISIAMALTAGIISFLSPCVLPLIPGYVSFISGISVADMADGTYRPGLFDKRHLAVLFNALCFVLGFSIVFIVLGASATWLGSYVSGHLRFFTKAAGLIIILFGLVKTGLIKTRFFMKDTRFRPGIKRQGPFFSLVLGMAFAFGWTPCTGPILGAILTYAGTVNQVEEGLWLLIVYSAGLGIPFLLTAFFIQYSFKFLKRIRPFLGIIEKGTGLVLILMGILVFTDSFYIMTNWFSSFGRFTL